VEGFCKGELGAAIDCQQWPFFIAEWKGFAIGNSERLNGEKNGRMPHFFSPFRVQTAARRAAANVRLNCHCETPSTAPVKKDNRQTTTLNYPLQNLSAVPIAKIPLSFYHTTRPYRYCSPV